MLLMPLLLLTSLVVVLVDLERRSAQLHPFTVLEGQQQEVSGLYIWSGSTQCESPHPHAGHMYMSHELVHHGVYLAMVLLVTLVGCVLLVIST